MDEQRCSAPHIFQNLGTPSAQHKNNLTSGTSGKPLWRSASLNRDKTEQRGQVNVHTTYHSTLFYLYFFCPVILYFLSKPRKLYSDELELLLSSLLKK